MNISQEDLVGILSKFNPWWKNHTETTLPSWKRCVFGELLNWTLSPPVHRAIMLSGARQVGKTTLMMQVIQHLIESNTHPNNILYATFDHPILKVAGIDLVLDAWRARTTKEEGPEYIFIDEAQFVPNWGTWVKHEVDFNKNRRILFTGSALPLLKQDQESGVGRWHTIHLTTLSFYEYLLLKKIKVPSLPKIASMHDLSNWKASNFYQAIDAAENYTGHFHRYLLSGGFPQTALMENIPQAQKLLSEDIVDKVLKRDMTALFGVRRILDLEQVFLYICLHDGSLLDMQNLCKHLEIKRPTIQNFIELLEATHLIRRLPPFGYGKDILRGRFKVYLEDPSISPAVMLKGLSLLDDPIALGVATESAVLKHVTSGFSKQNVKLSYWRNKKGEEVDIIVQSNNQILPFEVKYRASVSTKWQGLEAFCFEKKVSTAYVITKSIKDFKRIQKNSTPFILIPAPIFCYWMGKLEDD